MHGHSSIATCSMIVEVRAWTVGERVVVANVGVGLGAGKLLAVRNTVGVTAKIQGKVVKEKVGVERAALAPWRH